MLYEKLKQIICLVINQDLNGQALMDMLIEKINPNEVYESDDVLVTDSYFSLLHYAFGEEMVTDNEWKYFLECFNGEKIYSLDNKQNIKGENSRN